MGDSTEKNKKILFFLAIFVFVLALIFLLVFGVFLFVRSNKVSSNEVEGESYLYRYRKINPSENYTTAGFMHIPRKLESSVFYQEQDGERYVLISDFGSTEYQCTGSCICEEGSQRKAVTTVVVNGMLYLVAALTSIIAYDSAKKYFEDECQEELQDQCSSPDSTISSIMDDCEVMVDKINDEPSLDDLDVEEEYGSGQIFKCFGKCVNFDPTKNSVGMDPSEMWNSDEERISLKANFDIYMKKFNAKKGMCKKLTMEKEILKPQSTTIEFLKTIFIFTMLNSFCQQSSESEMKYGDDMMMEGEESFETFFCSGYSCSAFSGILDSPDFVSEKHTIDYMTDMTNLDTSIWKASVLNPSVQCVYVKDYEEPKNEEKK